MAAPNTNCWELRENWKNNPLSVYDTLYTILTSFLALVIQDPSSTPDIPLTNLVGLVRRVP